jgi:hypothetical protein
MSNEETKLQQAIQEALCWLPGVEAWALTTARRGKLAFGLRELGGNVAGGADIIGCVDGLLLWCEVKLPGNDVEPGSDQERRLEVARKLGAVAFVAHSVKEAVDFVQRRQRALRRGVKLLESMREYGQPVPDSVFNCPGCGAHDWGLHGSPCRHCGHAESSGPPEAPEQCCGCTDDCCCEHDDIRRVLKGASR